ncbi:hypothetical protein WAF85_003120 [Salmonella enterica]|uniref:Uncharacterized protein n=2 Tax=Salmonella enterica TaxID=28901 RepID=A0A5V0Q4G5_SALER|nr:hypothetical protein [Salmonella enterica]ECO1003637.1 hypothetical protein [Salmonella enterica subsp. enterica serovar Give]ECS7052028.1 hypothetical protein [Salmonella enterica subsp. enterica serovar Oranienburg]EDI3199117.1 hypothetical protein [Salmonella enterica subsp. enterica serovar Rubislaw]EDR1013857.1 hypothetical protein [Salmonella enterica subsp. enterica serovar Glostrup]ELJ2724975.1 hypothetical protein [Salmonella enterica subsp. enterica]
MKVELKSAAGENQPQEVTSLVITLSNGETIEISEEKQGRPTDLSEGITIWGGRIPRENASLEELKESTRMLGIYPLAANTLHLYPLKK